MLRTQPATDIPARRALLHGHSSLRPWYHRASIDRRRLRPASTRQELTGPKPPSQWSPPPPPPSLRSLTQARAAAATPTKTAGAPPPWLTSKPSRRRTAHPPALFVYGPLSLQRGQSGNWSQEKTIRNPNRVKQVLVKSRPPPIVRVSTRPQGETTWQTINLLPKTRDFFPVTRGAQHHDSPPSLAPQLVPGCEGGIT